MSLQAVTLARRKAALTRHYGADDPRTLAVAAELLVTRLRDLIEEHPDEAERAELLTAIGAGA